MEGARVIGTVGSILWTVNDHIIAVQTVNGQSAGRLGIHNDPCTVAAALQRARHIGIANDIIPRIAVQIGGWVANKIRAVIDRFAAN